MRPHGVRIGQVQWLLFWAALFCGDVAPGLWVVWIISLFFTDKNL